MARVKTLILVIVAIVIAVSCVALSGLYREHGIEIKSMDAETFRWFITLSAGMAALIVTLIWSPDGE